MNVSSRPKSDFPFQALLRGEAFPLFLHSSDGVLINANSAFLDLLGYSSEDLEEHRIPAIGALTSPQLRDRDDVMYLRVRSGGSSLFWRREFLRKGGGRLAVLAGAGWSDEEQAFVCCCFDLNEIEKDRQLRSLAAQLLSREDEEKRIIARRLHDTAAQNLAALSMNLALLGSEMPGDTRVLELLTECSGLTLECFNEVRSLSYTLHPPLLEELGLESALRSYVRDFTRYTAIQTTVQIALGPSRLSRQIESKLFRIIQERLTYLHGHADPTECLITLEDIGMSTIVTITDDATVNPSGADDEELGVSLAAMGERARQTNAQLSVESGSHGTAIRVILARS